MPGYWVGHTVILNDETRRKADMWRLAQDMARKAHREFQGPLWARQVLEDALLLETELETAQRLFRELY